MKRFPLSLLAVLAAGPGFACAAQAADLEVRFCPETVVRPYALDSLRGVQSLLLHNVAIANTGKTPATLQRVDLELLEGGRVVDTRALDRVALDRAAMSGLAVQQAGMMDAFAFQFCDGRLLQPHRLAANATLAPGEIVLVMQQVFAWKGERDAVRVSARTDADPDVAASATLRIDPAASRTVFRWPLEGGPWTVAGASFHGTHRWAIPEEFALDILQAGADGRTHRGDGARNADFHAYGAKVVAAAAGKVVRLIEGSNELPPLLRKPGESMPDYYARVSEQQARNIAAGDPGVFGDSVIIDHGNDEFSVYAHLAPGSIAVAAGEQVTAGQALGRLGSSGNSTEPHLHFQVCNSASPLSCAAIPPSFEGIQIHLADGPRPLQSGDVVTAAK